MFVWVDADTWVCRGQGRPDMEEDHKGLLLSLKHIFFSNILARTLVAKAHNSGIFPYEVNKITNCYLDWFYAALKHVYCLMNTRVLSNFGRIKVHPAFFFFGCVCRS